MADIASTDVVYTVGAKDVKKMEDGRKMVKASVAFGNGSLTYPSGGVPLLSGSLGCPTQIDSFTLTDPGSADGYLYKYDLTNNKIRIYQGDNNNASDSPAIELGNVAVAATTLVCNVVGY